MKPYYEQDGITIYHGDCREVLPLLRADVVLTDAPYGVGENYQDYEDSEPALVGLIDSIWPVICGAAPRKAIFCGAANIFRWPSPSWMLLWVTPAGIGCGPWGFCCYQPLLVYGPDPALQDGRGSYPDVFQNSDASPPNGHPCPKPPAVMRWAIQRVSRVSEVIIDPFMGSGTTLVEARRLGRKAIGIELTERYCEIAAKRLSQGVLSEMFV